SFSGPCQRSAGWGPRLGPELASLHVFRAAKRKGPPLSRNARRLAGLAADQHGAEGLGKYQPRVRQASARTKPGRSMAEDDHNFRQEADEEGGYWMDARTVGIRERETGVCRQKPI